MKIIFEHPETKARDFFSLDHTQREDGLGFAVSDFDQWKKKYDETDSRGFVEASGYGAIPKQSIKGFALMKEHKSDESSAPTRFETNPPTTEEWQALCAFVQDHFRWRAGTENIFLGTVKSIWNWDSQKTKDALETGREILKSKSELDIFY